MRSLLFAAFVLAAVSAENRDPGSESSTGGSSHVAAAIAAADSSKSVPPKQEPHHLANTPLILPQFGIPIAHPNLHALQEINPAFVFPQNLHYHGGGPVYKKLPVRSHENHVGLFPAFGKYPGHQSHIYPNHNGFYNFANNGAFGAFGNHNYFTNYQNGFNYLTAPDYQHFGGHSNFAAPQKPVDLSKAQKGSHNVEKKTVNLFKTANAGSKKEQSSKFGLHNILKYFSNHVKHTKVDPKGSPAGTTKYDKNIVKYTGGADKTKLSPVDHATNIGNHQTTKTGNNQIGSHLLEAAGHPLGNTESHILGSTGSHQFVNTGGHYLQNAGSYLLGNAGHSLENAGGHHIGSQPEIIVEKFHNNIGSHPYINLENIKFSAVSAYEEKSPANLQNNQHHPAGPQYPPIPQYLAVPQNPLKSSNSEAKNPAVQYSKAQHTGPQYPPIPQYLLVPQNPSNSDAQYTNVQHPGYSAQQYPGAQYFRFQYPTETQHSVQPQHYAVNPAGLQYYVQPQATAGHQYSAQPQHSAGVQFVTGADTKQNFEHAGANPNFDHTKLNYQNLLQQYSQPQALQYVQEHPVSNNAKYLAGNVQYVQEQPASRENNIKYVAENVQYEHPQSAGKTAKNFQYVQEPSGRNFKYVPGNVQYVHPEAAEQNAKYVQYVQVPSLQENVKYTAENQKGGKPHAYAGSQISEQNGGNQKFAALHNSGYTGNNILDLTGSQIGEGTQYLTHPASNGAKFDFYNFGFTGMPNSENAVTIDLTGTLKEGAGYTAQQKRGQKLQDNVKHVTPDFTGNQGTHQQHFIQYVYSPTQEHVKFDKADAQVVVRHSGSEKFEFEPQKQIFQNQDYQYEVSEGQRDKVKNNLARFSETARQEAKEQEKRNGQKAEYNRQEYQSPKYKSKESQSPKYKGLESKTEKIAYPSQKGQEYSGLEYQSQHSRSNNAEDKTTESKTQNPNYKSQEYYVEYQSPIYKNQLVYQTDDSPSYKSGEYQSTAYKYLDFKPVYENPTHLEDRKQNVQNLANFKTSVANKEQIQEEGNKKVQDRQLQSQQKLVEYKEIQKPQTFESSSKSEAQDYQSLKQNQPNLEREDKNFEQKYLNLGEYYIRADPKQQGSTYSLDGEHNYVYYIKGQGENNNQEQQNVAYILDKGFDQGKKQQEQNVDYIVDKSFQEENEKPVSQNQQNLNEQQAKHQYASQEFHGDSSQKPSDLSKQHSSQFPQKASYSQVPSEQFAQQFHQQSPAQNKGDYSYIRFSLSQEHKVQSATPNSERNFIDSAKQESMRALKEEVLRSFEKDYDLSDLKSDKESGEILQSKQEDYNLSYSNSSDKDEGDEGEIKKYEASTVSSHGDH